MFLFSLAIFEGFQFPVSNSVFPAGKLMWSCCEDVFKKTLDLTIRNCPCYAQGQDWDGWLQGLKPRNTKDRKQTS
jgi:hypothetical protein